MIVVVIMKIVMVKEDELSGAFLRKHISPTSFCIPPTLGTTLPQSYHLLLRLNVWVMMTLTRYLLLLAFPSVTVSSHFLTFAITMPALVGKKKGSRKVNSFYMKVLSRPILGLNAKCGTGTVCSPAKYCFSWSLDHFFSRIWTIQS